LNLWQKPVDFMVLHDVIKPSHNGEYFLKNQSSFESEEHRPLLSIIIATRNRQKYAKAAVTSILSIPDPRLELIIQDNSDDETLEAALQVHMSDSRLKYQYTPPPLSIVGNFNKAIELSNGEFLCMIGDDDGVNPEIVEAAQWAQSNELDALVGSLTANYRWAGTGAPDTLFTRMTDSTLVLTHFNGRIKHVDIEESLRQFGNDGFTYYLDFALPKLYHGIVKRDRLKELWRRNGTYIRGLSTDIYLSVSLACIVRNLVVIDYPLTLPGVCPESSSVVEGQIRKHSRRLEDAPHFRSNPGYVWSEEVPPVYCVETLWTDSALHALRDMNRQDLLAQFNCYRMYANIINANRETKDDCIKHMRSRPSASLMIDGLSLIWAFTGPLKRFLRKRALSRILIILRIKRLKEINDLHDIVAATDALKKYLKTVSKKLYPIPFSMEKK